MSAFSLCGRTTLAINAVHKAFGAPGVYGYETPQGRALIDLYQLGFAIAHRATPDAAEPLEDRLAECLADCVDTTLLTLRDPANGWPIELRLGSFDQQLGERAAALLEEAGR